MKNGRHIAEFYGVGVMLAIVGGYLDAYTYISRDHVFANAQTGNMVLLAINIKEGSWLKVFLYLMPILSLKLKFNEHPRIHWHRIIIGVELVVLTIVGFIPAGTLNTLANILVSFTCAMQVEGFRKMDGKPFATTMCTGNLRSGTDNLFQYLKTKDKQKLGNAMQYYGIILCFIGGAAVGAFVTELLETKAVFVALTGLVIALCILRSDDDKLAEGK